MCHSRRHGKLRSDPRSVLCPGKAGPRALLSESQWGAGSVQAEGLQVTAMPAHLVQPLTLLNWQVKSRPP